MSVWSPRRLVLMHLPEKCHVLQHSSRSKDGKPPPIISTTQRNSFSSSSSYQNFSGSFYTYIGARLYQKSLGIWDTQLQVIFYACQFESQKRILEIDTQGIPLEFLKISSRAILLSSFIAHSLWKVGFRQFSLDTH